MDLRCVQHLVAGWHMNIYGSARLQIVWGKACVRDCTVQCLLVSRILLPFASFVRIRQSLAGLLRRSTCKTEQGENRSSFQQHRRTLNIAQARQPPDGTTSAHTPPFGMQPSPLLLLPGVQLLLLEHL